MALYSQRIQLPGVLLCLWRAELFPGDQTLLRIPRRRTHRPRAATRVHHRIDPRLVDRIFGVVVPAIHSRDTPTIDGQHWVAALRSRRDHSTYLADQFTASLPVICQRD